MSSKLVLDLRRVMDEVLPVRGPAEAAEFTGLGVQEQVWRFLNWQSRLVHPHRRQVFRSDGLAAGLASYANRAEVCLLLARLAAGLDVSPHLSRGIRDGYRLHGTRKDGPDFDLMLNEWGIHHLHLSSQQEVGGFNRRTDELLFAIVRPEAVYAIGVGTHDDWAAPRLVQEVVGSWPDQRFFTKMSVLPGEPFSPGDHQRLRKAGWTSLTSVEDVPYVCTLTGGLTTALVSVAVSKEASRVLRAVSAVDADPDLGLERLKAEARKYGLRWPRKPRLGIVRESGPTGWIFGLIEHGSGATMAV